MSTTYEIGKKLVQLCQAGKNVEAIDTLYAPNIVSIEAGSPDGKSPRTEGIAGVKGKSEWWVNNHEVHSGECKGPWPHGDRFAVYFKYDVTPKSGPMKGKRFVMEETALYTVKNDKITQEEFFYHMGM